MDSFTEMNRELWDAWTTIHEHSRHYDIEGFKSGKLRLSAIEREELGDVAGRSLLHLQCHFGLDTLSLARLGAQVTGIDFSKNAIELAKALSRQLNVPADFICADIYDLPQVLSGTFDIIFTSYGVLCWLQDLTRWAQILARFLKPGGRFYIAEFHPFACIFDDDDAVTELSVRYPYFSNEEPKKLYTHASYADDAVEHRAIYYTWSHSLSEVMTVLLNAGMTIEFLHEFPFGPEKLSPLMFKGEDGWWRWQDQHNSIPVTFSLGAHKGTIAFESNHGSST